MLLGAGAPVSAFIWMPILVVAFLFWLVADTALLPVTICTEYMKGGKKMEVGSEAPVEPESEGGTAPAPSPLK